MWRIAFSITLLATLCTQIWDWPSWVMYVIRPWVTISILGMAFAETKQFDSSLKRFFLLGFFVFAISDCLIMFQMQSETFLHLGLVAFGLQSFIMSIVWLREGKVAAMPSFIWRSRWIFLWAICLMALILGLWWPSLKQNKVFVIIAAIGMITHLLTVINRIDTVTENSFQLGLLGAVAITVGTIIFGIDKFVYALPWRKFFVMLPYYLGPTVLIRAFVKEQAFRKHPISSF